MKLTYTCKDEVIFTKSASVAPQIGTKIFFKEMDSKDTKRYKVSEIHEHISYSYFCNGYSVDKVEVVLVEDRGGLH